MKLRSFKQRIFSDSDNGKLTPTAKRIKKIVCYFGQQSYNTQADIGTT